MTRKQSIVATLFNTGPRLGALSARTLRNPRFMASVYVLVTCSLALTTSPDPTNLDVSFTFQCSDVGSERLFACRTRTIFPPWTSETRTPKLL